MKLRKEWGMARLVIPLLMLLTSTACGTHTVKPSQVVIVVPPDSLLLDCPVNEPPKDLLKPTLVKGWHDKTINLAICNNNMGKLSEWTTTILKIKQYQHINQSGISGFLPGSK